MFLPSSLGALQVKSEIIVTVNEIPAHGEIRASTARGPPDARGAPIRVGWASPLRVATGGAASDGSKARPRRSPAPANRTAGVGFCLMKLAPSAPTTADQATGAWTFCTPTACGHISPGQPPWENRRAIPTRPARAGAVASVPRSRLIHATPEVREERPAPFQGAGV